MADISEPALTPRVVVEAFDRRWRWEYRWARRHGRTVLESLRWSSAQVRVRRSRLAS